MLPFVVLLLAGAGVAYAALGLGRGSSPRRAGPSVRSRRVRRAPWFAARGRAGYAVLALITLAGMVVLLDRLGLVTRGAAAPPGEFVVRVAPFRSAGADPRGGVIVAEQLVAELRARATTPMDIATVDEPAETAQQAEQLAAGADWDVLIWGEAAAGTTAEQRGLRPRLVWHPAQPFAPRAWQGYDGHFVLPAGYDVALAELNAPVVLAPLLDSLNHFSRGDADRAAVMLERLLRDYGDVLNAELPQMVLGQIAWAENRLDAAEIHARAALEAVPRPEQQQNLGAILLDRQQLEAARTLFDEALAEAPDLPQAHANLGRVSMNLDRPADALPDLRSAASALPQSPAMVAQLGEGLRRAGYLDEARAAQGRVLELDPGNGPAVAEQGMLALTIVTRTARLEWELEGPPTRTAEELAEIRAAIAGGLGAIETRRNEFLRQANAYGVSARPVMQRLAETQASKLDQELLTRRYQLMLAQVEQGRVLALAPRRGVRRFWDALIGRPTPLVEAITVARDALGKQPGPGLQYDYLYQSGRAARLGKNPGLAREQWDAAVAIVPPAPDGTPVQRPEAHFGRAVLLLNENQGPEAQAELDSAVAADARYFPALELLAQRAEAERRWQDAASLYRGLAETRPERLLYRLALARVLAEQGAYAEAEAQLLPPAGAGDREALRQLIALYRRADRLPEAGQALEHALRIAPGDAAIREEAAQLAIARGDAEGAEAELLRALELAPDRGTAKVALGRLYAGPLNRPQDAARQFQSAVENSSADPLVHRQLGEVLLEIGNPRAAIDSFRRALKLDGESHEAQHGLASAYLALGEVDQALKAEQRALELAGGNYTLAIVGLGDIAREQRRFDEAIARYHEALERDARLPAAFLGLGQVALAQSQPAIALQHFGDGLAVEPDNIALLLAQGDAQLQLNDANAAIGSFTRAGELDPARATAYSGLGRAYWSAGQTEAALDELQRAVQLNPLDAGALLTLGEINAALGHDKDALEAYTRSAKARPNWYEPRFRRGVLLLKSERTAEAIDELEVAIRLDPELAQGHYWLGRSLRAAGRFAEARRRLERAIELRSDYWEARFFLGRTLDELGSAPDAIAAYEVVLAEAPSNDPWRAEAERELDRIR